MAGTRETLRLSAAAAPLKPLNKLLLLCLLLVALTCDARDRNQVNAFKKQHHCPVTNKQYGACHGWEVDHVIPLKCGGADHPSNMQWLTKRAHKLKTAREAKLCRKPK